ncbi:MAG TPA: response regulator transcription factor [Acidobacteriota bacterium]|jgi:DNA-binding NarL/FixJ family response regulator
MIRVGFESTEQIPGSLITRLKTSADVEIAEKEFDVLLIYTKIWNRSASLRIYRNSKVPVIICDSYEDPFATESLLRQHVAGILLTETSTQQLIAALHAAAAGLKFLQPLKIRSNNLLPVETLTQRELEILGLIADGEGNKSIASLLNISHHTVKFHISSIFEKLNVSSRTEAIKAGISRGLVSI